MSRDASNRIKQKETMKRSRLSMWVGWTGLLMIVAGCSDPSEGVYRAAGTDPQAASGLGAVTGMPYVIRSESKIEFVGSKVTGSHDGGFHRIAGMIYAENGRVLGTSEIRIDMDSTWSDNTRLTAHLKNDDFFDVPNHPVSTFVVTSVEPDGAGQKVTGNLTLRGVTRSITFPATVRVDENAVTVQAQFAINRKDFGVNYSGRADDLIRDNVVIKLDLTATPGAPRPQDQLTL
jgi:polyisoprenoid-binding protein YceI